MKKRYLRKFLTGDDSFTGSLYLSKFTGLPFNFLITLRLFKNDKIPRIHIVEVNDENLAKLPTTRSYSILGPGKIKRITLYHKDFNEEHEEILRKITKEFYTEIYNYFYDIDNKGIRESELKARLAL